MLITQNDVESQFHLKLILIVMVETGNFNIGTLVRIQIQPQLKCLLLIVLLFNAMTVFSFMYKTFIVVKLSRHFTHIGVAQGHDFLYVYSMIRFTAQGGGRNINCRILSIAEYWNGCITDFLK